MTKLQVPAFLADWSEATLRTVDEQRAAIQAEITTLNGSLAYLEHIRTQLTQNVEVLRQKPKKITTALRNARRYRLPAPGTQSASVGQRLLEVLSRTNPETAEELFLKYFKRHNIKKQSVHGALYILEANGLVVKAPPKLGVRTQWLLTKTANRKPNGNVHNERPVLKPAKKKKRSYSYHGTHWTQRPGGKEKLSTALLRHNEKKRLANQTTVT